MKDFNSAQQIAAAVIDALKSERMSLAKALRMIERGQEKAGTLNIPMVITVVDEGGNMTAMHRMDNSLLASIAISYSKAYTALALRSTTEEAAGGILPGQPLYGLQETHPGRFCLFGGGVPIFSNGRCIGAVGVSGGTVEQDMEVARYAAEVN